MFRQFGFDDCFVGVTSGAVDAGFVSGPVEVPEGVEMRLLRNDPSSPPWRRTTPSRRAAQ